ncbi:reverse transcriptase family protein [Tenuifilum thalassicum]|uniref:RNA-directed DNA polymerase n=1 Tax=Tenuifilum thalassicum TaxID=2590900 RepID=A0A7D3XCV0_9BACT|nr:reverse transcriptase family protein [Tenuifilum thalassicum]QKG79312.1 RNA-directed DNA polymerase [Tenuifilum thalassicum]
MKVDKVHIEQLRKQFAEMQSKDDLLKLLNNAKKMLYGENSMPFQKKSLTYYANPDLCKKRYQTFTIKKKSGEDRIIHSPVSGLKSILRVLNFVLQCIYEPHKAATGFVLNKSIVDNAKKHLGQNYVYNIDLKDFFHSFDRNRVKIGFMYEPFNLKGDKESLAFLLACLCTHPLEVDGEIKTVLPQGSPTSPTLTNILCKKLDRRLTGLAKRFGATYTRYADDITFSSLHNIYKDDDFIKELKRIIEEDQKLVINPNKTRLQKAGYRQEATGLIVNEKVNVHRRYIKQIRMWLYYWEKYGYEKAEQIFKRDYIADKGHVKNMNAHLVNVLDGKLEFLKMVKGFKDSTYQGLKKRFDRLTKSENPIENNEIIEQNRTQEHLNVLSEDKKAIFHDPKLVINKLEQFTSDPIMKWLTHFWDTSPDINSESNSSTENYFKAVNSRYEEFVFLQKYNANLWWNVIYPFVFQKKISTNKEGKEIPFKWGKYGIKIGWQYPDSVINWIVENYDNKPHALKKTPFEMSISDDLVSAEANQKYRLMYGKEIRFFGDIINLFKREIAFREETRDFYYEINNLVLQELREFKVSGLETLKYESFTVYTVPVLKAIRRIFRMIQTRTENREVEISCNRLSNQNLILLKIIHIGSHPLKNSEHSKFMKPSGDLEEVIKPLISICDFEVAAHFTDGDFVLKYLYPNVKISHENSQFHIAEIKKEDCIVKGFTYILKFYLP